MGSTLIQTTYAMPAASLGRNNPLPSLDSDADVHGSVAVDKSTISSEEAKYMGWAKVHSILPYTIQDGYNRTKRTRNFRAFVLENKYLKATVLPQLGGRLWSLVDKITGKELLHTNPVFQPCNLALRNAWFSGGVEWNVGIIGHTPFTAEDMVCQRLELSDGTPVLRMFQYERIRHLFYRVELLLPAESKELYVRVRIDNATQEDTAVYWWSNMAVNEGENIRVVVPAEKAFSLGYGGHVSKVSVPYMTAEADKLTGKAARIARENGGTVKLDVSHSTQLPQSMDFFFDIPEGVRPFIAALDETGYGMCQTSTRELMGRKLFAWGMGEGGRRWQHFLSQEGSAYIELQSGLAKTQLEHLPMAAGETISWLESYGAVKANPETVHGKDYAAAVDCVAQALEVVRPEGNLEKLHRRLKRELDGRNGPVIHRGMGFARVEQMLLGECFQTAGLRLDGMRLGAEESPWVSLVKTGKLPCPYPMTPPTSYQIGPAWEKCLRQSIERGDSDHWFGHYQLGVMQASRNDWQSAHQAFCTSLERQRNPWALRCLAISYKRMGNNADAVALMLEAVSLKPIRMLVVEAVQMLAGMGEYEKIEQILQIIPESLRKNGSIRVAQIQMLIRTGKLDKAERMLMGKLTLTDIRECSTVLSDLWFELMAIRYHGGVTPKSIAWVKENLTPPKHLDFRMT